MRFHVLIRQLSRLVFALSFAIIVFGISPSTFVQAQDESPVNLFRFDVLTTNSGWILLERHLFWTSNAGQTWEEIGPSIPLGALVQDVEFKDANTGWLLWTTANFDGNAEFQLAHTTDIGITWTTHSLSLFEPGEIASKAEKAEMGWFDPQTGWISVKQNTGSNFSLGVLFTTSDGGNTWSRSNLPVTDNIYFRDPQNGWAVGGPANDQLFETRDAGVSWEKVQPVAIPEDSQTVIYSPFFSDGQSLLVMTSLGEATSLNVYTLQNSSDEWLSTGQIKLDAQTGNIGLSILDAENFVAIVPGTKSIMRMTDGELNLLENKDGLAASIVELDMASLDVGWGKSIDASCITASV